MAKVLVERKVIFSGMWKTSPTNDVERQLRTISDEFRSKPGLPASFRLTTSGVEVYIISENGLAGKSKKVDMSSIYDVVVNKYNALCLMVVFGDSSGAYIFLVCLCEKEVDGVEVTKVFRAHRHRTAMKSDANRHNWVLKQKQPANNNNEGEGNSMSSVDGASCDTSSVATSPDGSNPNTSLATSLGSSGYHSAIVHRPDEVDQIKMSSSGHNGHSDNDVDSTVSAESYNSMRDELVHLSEEVRNIKLLLQQKGIDQDDRVHAVGDTTDNERESLTSYNSLKPELTLNDRRVNFAVEESKSASLPRDHARHGLYVKKQNPQRSSAKTHYYRNSSSGTSAGTPSPAPTGSNDVFVYPASSAGAPEGYIRQRKGSHSGLATSIVKPIEQVYMVQPRQPHSARRKVVLHPGKSSTLPAMRSSSGSEKPSTPILKNGNH